ncbi:MAG: GspJ family type II secretion system protein [Sedimentisphaerales bacterium]|nr:GspJ family type II secretion system protein [Sedimentisphaerales bacterium]
MSERTAKREAFTLLEIIIALSMLVLILGSVYGTYSAATRALAHSKPKHALQQQATVFLQRITSEIRCCYAGYKDESPQPAANNIRDGEIERLKQEDSPLFEAREVSSGRSFLQFVTSAVASKREQSFGGLAIVEYMWDSSANTLSRSKRRYVGGFEVDKDNYNWVVVLENVQMMSVEYFDGEEWLKEWNSNDTEGLLPQAAGISLIMQSEDVGPLSFASTVKIVCKANKSGGVTVQKTSESDKMLRSIDNNKNR